MRPTSTLVPPICAVEVLFVVSIDTAVTVPVCVLPSVAVYDTARPTSAPAERERCIASSWVFCEAICCSDCVWVSVAVCAIMSLVLIGLLGSWYFISATSSLRNMSLPIWSSRLTWLVDDVVTGIVGSVAPTGELIRGASLSHTRTSRADDVALVEVRTGRPSPRSADRIQGRGRCSPRPGWPC